jgi:protein-disulfide isomerase
MNRARRARELTWGWALLLLACASPPVRSASNEIDLANPTEEPEEALPPVRQQTCNKDDVGCRRAAAEAEEVRGAPELDPAESYEVSIAPSDPKRGPTNARVSAIVFSDFQCPFCRHLELTLAELSLRHPADLQVVWKDLPLDSHVHARPAALLAREAQARGGDVLFWQVHGALYKQAALNDATLAQVAAQFNLHWPPLSQYEPLIDASYAQGVALNVRATPTTFVNGRPIVGVKPIEVFEQRIREELARQPSAMVGTPTVRTF